MHGWALVMAAGIAVANEPTYWQEGPCVYYSFRPAVSIRTEEESATVRLMLPKPHEDRWQSLVKPIEAPVASRRSNLFDRSRLNELIVAEMEVEPEEPVEYSYTAIVCLRERTLAQDAHESTGPWELPEAQRRQLRDFLKLTPMTGKGRDDLAAFAAEVVDSETNTLVIARRLYDAVLGRMSYDQRLQFKGAARAWDEQIGECCDYSALFVSLCRSAGVPARSVNGFVFSESHWRLHVWAEFYAHGIGWVPCDLSHGDFDNATAEANFGHLSDSHLAVTRDFDLDFGKQSFLKAGLLQQYLFSYQGPERPTIEFRVEGERFGETLPPQYEVEDAEPGRPRKRDRR